MKINKIDIEPVYVLELTIRESQLLMALVQNPLHDDEPEDCGTLRRNIFDHFKGLGLCI